MSRQTEFVLMPEKIGVLPQIVNAKEQLKALAAIQPGSEITVAFGYDRTFLYYFQVMDGDGELIMDVDTMNNNLGHGPMLELMQMFKVGTDQDKMLVAADLPI